MIRAGRAHCRQRGKWRILPFGSLLPSDDKTWGKSPLSLNTKKAEFIWGSSASRGKLDEGRDRFGSCRPFYRFARKLRHIAPRRGQSDRVGIKEADSVYQVSFSFYDTIITFTVPSSSPFSPDLTTISLFLRRTIHSLHWQQWWRWIGSHHHLVATGDAWLLIGWHSEYRACAVRLDLLR